jgi:hypothetical protein
MPLGFGLTEKQILQITEDTEKPRWRMELLESVSPRPRQARFHRPSKHDTHDFGVYLVSVSGGHHRDLVVRNQKGRPHMASLK